MKLLFDQNLSSALARKLSDLFPESAHVKDLGMAKVDDRAVWTFAKENGFAIVSKDSDFQQLSLFFGAPPTVIWLRIGNCTNRVLFGWLEPLLPEIKTRLNADEKIIEVR